MSDPRHEVAALRKRCRAHRGAYPRLAEAAGLSYHWLTQFVRGAQNNPTASTMARLHRGLAALESSRKPRRVKRA